MDEISSWAGQFYLVVSRLMPYKNVDRAIAAFADMPQRKLAIVGKGPEAERLAAMCPDNVRMFQGLSDGQMRWLYANCRALIAPSFEDFGLTPLEAYSFGKPVLALRGGGYLDTVVEGQTGLFFSKPTSADIAAIVEKNEQITWDHPAIRAHGEKFSLDRFIQALHQQVEALS